MSVRRLGRAFLRRWPGVAAPALLAAIAIALLEVVFVAELVPAAASSSAGLLLEGAMTLALLGVAALAMSVPVGFLGRPRVSRAFSRSGPVVALAVAWALVALAPVVLLSRLSDAEWQTPHIIGELQGLLLFGVLVAACASAILTRTRFAVLFARLPWRARRATAPVLAGLASAGAVAVAHLLLQPAYRVYECGAVGLAGLFLGTLAVCAAPRPVSRRVLGILAGLAVASTGTWLLRGAAADHARFLVWNHGAIAAPLAKIVRDALDRDHDASAPTWLGGTDCAEGNPDRGPLLREIPGDGVDQDCRGGDAPPPAPVPSATVPPDCRLPDRKLSVLLVTVDALRADRTTPQTMPALFELARHGTTFTNAHSPAGMTITSLAALFAARPSSDMVTNALTDGDLRAPFTLAELFRDAGWRTAAFNPFGVMHAIHRRGFQKYNDDWMDAFPRGAESMLTGRTVAREAASFASASDAPFFAWAHFADVHAPYKFDHGPDGAHTEDESYDLGVAYVGAALDSLFAALSEKGVLARTIVVVTSDHGEELMARGREAHGVDMFEEGTHVPLVMWIPGCAPRVANEPVGTIQLGPTLGALTGVAVPGWGLFDHRPLPVVTEATVGYDVQFKRAVLGDRYKLIVDVANGGRMLFDLKEDPGETNDVYGSNPAARDAMEAAYQRWLDSPGAR